MKILQKKYLLIAAVFIFFGFLFFAQNVSAVDCLGAGERCILLTEDGEGCGGDEAIGTCGENGEKTCCKAKNSCPAGKDGICKLKTEQCISPDVDLGACTDSSYKCCGPPSSSPACPAGKEGICKLKSEQCISPDVDLGACTDSSYKCCGPPSSSPACPAGKEGICKLKSEQCISPDVDLGACTDPNLKCCGPPSPAGSCTGGECKGDGKCVDPFPVDSGTKCTNGGACCMPKTSSGGGGNMVNISFANPLAYDTVEGVLDSILDTIRAIIVTLALVFLVVGAVLYITSAGNDGMMKMAKGAITAAMIGLAIGLAAPSFLREISGVLGWTSVNNPDVEKALTLSQIALRVLQFLLSIVGILAIIMLVVGGIIYMTGATTGDEKSKVQTGKNIVKYAIIGIFISLASLVIVSQIAEFFM